MERFAWRCRCIVLAGTVMSCAEDDGEPEIGTPVASGRYIDLWASDDLEVCGGTLVYMDDFIDALRGYVGPQPEADPRHRVHLLDNTDFAASPCDSDNGGCAARGRTVYSRESNILLHELTHAELWSHSNSCLEEGVAVMLGDATLEGNAVVGDAHTCFAAGRARRLRRRCVVRRRARGGRRAGQCGHAVSSVVEVVASRAPLTGRALASVGPAKMAPRGLRGPT